MGQNPNQNHEMLEYLALISSIINLIASSICDYFGGVLCGSYYLVVLCGRHCMVGPIHCQFMACSRTTGIVLILGPAELDLIYQSQQHPINEVFDVGILSLNPPYLRPN